MILLLLKIGLLMKGNMMKTIGLILSGIVALIIVGSSAFISPFKYEAYSTELNSTSTANTIDIDTPPPFVVTHIQTPEPVKSLYMTSWVAGSKKLRDNLVNIIDTSELNAVVIDIKDYTGRVSFMVENPDLQKIGSSENRIPDIKEFIGLLHEKGIYVIGRISS